MCFQFLFTVVSWYLGWYDYDNTNDRTELINPIGQPNSWSVTRTLVGISDWGDSQSSWGNPPATTDYPVVIKLETGSSSEYKQVNLFDALRNINCYLLRRLLRGFQSR